MPMSDISNSEDDSLNLDDWLELPSDLFDSQRSKMGLGTNEIRQCLSEQNQRLADWNSNQFVMLLSNVVAHRKAVMNKGIPGSSASDASAGSDMGNAHSGVDDSGGVLRDVADTIKMPCYDGKVFVAVESTAANLSELVQQQLHDFVSILCSLYVDHPFHNYQHAVSAYHLEKWRFAERVLLTLVMPRLHRATSLCQLSNCYRPFLILNIVPISKTTAVTGLRSGTRKKANAFIRRHLGFPLTP
jgi:hypothetical protein